MRGDAQKNQMSVTAALLVQLKEASLFFVHSDPLLYLMN